MRVTAVAVLLGSGAVLPAITQEAAAANLPSFYKVPATLPSGPPGTVIRYERISSGSLDGAVYRIMYVSTNVRHQRVAVTGIVVLPHRPAPAGGYPVVSWGHGTNGMAEQCAPSLQPDSAVPETNKLLAQGWEVTASDYQGEGTPGPLPYLVGVDAARNTIDIVQAAVRVHAFHASHTYVVWGHSEGGQTAMFALHIGPSYAPDLHLAGVVAGAPPSQFNLIYQFLTTSPFRYYLFMAAEGYNVGYGNQAAPLSEVLTLKAEKLLPILEQGCANYVAAKADKYTLASMVKANPFSVPKWRTLLAANDPEDFTSVNAVPLLIIQGGADEQIPVVSTQLLAQHLCSIGQDLERWIYPGQSHAGVIAPSANDMIHWIADRFAGQPNPDPYMPTGMSGIQTTTCPSGTS